MPEFPQREIPLLIRIQVQLNLLHYFLELPTISADARIIITNRKDNIGQIQNQSR
jgi:hypothetical protein